MILKYALLSLYFYKERRVFLFLYKDFKMEISINNNVQEIGENKKAR